ncbi:MAG: DivIVA domain-containing protein [Acidimicrobiia bacterium]
MAASLSRPDPSSPASVAEAGFSTGRRGYQQDEVRAFLVSVAAELGRLQERERQLEAELREAREAADLAPSKLDEATVTELLGEETVRVLQTARESASQIKIRAEENAAQILREANDEANRLRQESEVDVARRRQEAAADAEAEVALAKQQGREMVNEARAYRERVLADLDRRTTLARKQIEELIHGRDRLLQVFERARLVAVDVTSELRDIDTPDELVNLTPTTGPVPIMVPNQRRGAVPVVEPAASEQSEEGPGDDAEASGPGEAPDAATTDAEEPGTDGAAEPDPVDVDEVTADEPAAEQPGADEAVGGEAAGDVVDDAVAEVDGEPEPDEPAPTARPADTNVVSLFRDRPVRDDADEHDQDDHDPEPSATDSVGGLFARLRDELPSEPVDADESTEPEADHDTDSDTDAVVESAFTRRDEALVPLIVSAARKVKRVLADEQNLVLDTLRQKEPVTELDDLVPDLAEHTATYRTAIVDELTAAAAAGAVELGAADTRTLRNRLGRAGALDDADVLVRTALIGPLRDRIERSISEGSGDNESIARRIRAVYREWKTQHIDGQLDDVFRYAHGGGIAVTAEPGTPMVWTIDPSEPACPDCEDNSLSGEVPAGEPFPTGHTAAPAHPGCRCLVIPAT